MEDNGNGTFDSEVEYLKLSCIYKSGIVYQNKSNLENRTNYYLNLYFTIHSLVDY